MGYTDEDVETHTFLPHITLPGVRATPSMLPTALELAVATFMLYMRIWELQKAAPARKWRAKMPIHPSGTKTYPLSTVTCKKA